MVLYQFSRPLSRSEGDEDEKRSQKAILSKFKEISVENFSRTQFRAQFRLDIFET